MPEKVFIGIDPGKSGGMAFVFPDDGVLPISFIDLSRGHLFARLLVLSGKHETFALIEEVHSMPKQGVVSAFTFGVNYGGLLMALDGCKIPYEEISPTKWQTGMGTRKRKKGETQTHWKTYLRNRAQRLFPKLDVWDKTKKEQLAVADALLIAEFCRRTHKEK